MFGISEGELVLILLFAFLVFGPDKLPGMGRTLGRALRQFKNAQEGFTEVVQTNIVDPAAEALSDDAKRPNRRRAEALDEDADIDGAEGDDRPRPKRTETFAERKKRLAAEKAREAEAEQAAAGQGADVEEGLDLAPEAPAASDVAPAQTAPAGKPSLADLYTMRRPSRPAESDAEAEAALGAGHEESEALGAERRADGSAAAGASADDTEKEAE